MKFFDRRNEVNKKRDKAIDIVAGLHKEYYGVEPELILCKWTKVFGINEEFFISADSVLYEVGHTNGRWGVTVYEVKHTRRWCDIP